MDFSLRWLNLAIRLLITSVSLQSLYNARPTAVCASGEPRVFLISLDGFRADYLDKTDMPNFKQLISDGVRAKFTYDAFITKTFPNHYTIVTGMYEESHGIVGNRMYDPVWDEHFALGKPSSLEPRWWSGGEPIWITNQNHLGQSAVINWPGSDVQIRQQYPTYHLPRYNSSIPFTDVIDWVLDHFKSNPDDVNLGIAYYPEPDHTGHMFGPSSPELISTLQSLDKDIGYLIETLKKDGLYDTTNIIITSDHGMTDVSVDRVIELDHYINESWYNFDKNNPVIGIWPKNDTTVDMIYSELVNVSDKMSVYKKDDIPKEFHYHDNRRIAPILLVAKEGWSIFQDVHKAFPNWNDTKYFKGAHGYDNKLESMHPVFVAHGPIFNQDQPDATPFYNVDIYPLICHILGIPPSPNNGSLNRIAHILKVKPTKLPTSIGPVPSNSTTGPLPTSDHPGTILSMTAIIALSVAFGVGLLAAIIFSAMCIKQRTYRQPPCNYKPIVDTSLDLCEDDVREVYVPNNNQGDREFSKLYI